MSTRPDSYPDAPPVWGAPATDLDPDPTPAPKQQRRKHDKPVPWDTDIRTTNNTINYGYYSFEALYRGFRRRLIKDPKFESQILGMIMDRLMAELYVPMNRTPRKGLVLELRRRARRQMVYGDEIDDKQPDNAKMPVIPKT